MWEIWFLTAMFAVAIFLIMNRDANRKYAQAQCDILRKLAKENGYDIIVGPQRVSYIAEVRGISNVKVNAELGIAKEGCVFKTQKMTGIKFLPFEKMKVLNAVQTATRVGMPGNMLHLIFQDGAEVHIFVFGNANQWRNKIEELQNNRNPDTVSIIQN